MTAADVARGSVTDTATATGEGGTGGTSPPSDPSTEVVKTQPPAPEVTISKLAVVSPAADQDAAELSNSASQYSYLITNIGNVNLTSVAVDDPHIGSVTCPTPAPPGLAPGSSVTCTADAPHTVTQDDIDAGEVTAPPRPQGSEKRAAPAPVRPGDGHDSDRGRRPAGLIVKSGDVSPAADQNAVLVDDTIAYSYVVTNTGNVSLTSVAVNDPTIGPVTCPTPSPSLAPGDSVTSPPTRRTPSPKATSMPARSPTRPPPPEPGSAEAHHRRPTRPR